MNRPIIIMGTGGFAIELWALVRAAEISVSGFIGPDCVSSLPAPYLGTDDVLRNAMPAAAILVAVGEPHVRKKLHELVMAAGRILSTFVSPSSFVAADAIIQPGCIIYPNATVHARCSLGRGVLVNSNASVGHETIVEDFVNIGPGTALGGRCRIGERSQLGLGCSILPNLSMIAETIIGAGAVVTKDISKCGTYIGVPAHRRKP